MDYFKEAFSGFNPQCDRDAALKFCLDSLAADHRIGDLKRLISDDSQLGGIEGEPGWIIECRREEESGGYEAWPENARFRAYVDPDSYSLGYPEFFADKQTFFRYIQAIIAVYKRRHPECVLEVRGIDEAIAAAAK